MRKRKSPTAGTATNEYLKSLPHIKNNRLKTRELILRELLILQNSIKILELFNPFVNSMANRVKLEYLRLKYSTLHLYYKTKNNYKFNPKHK